MSFLGSKQASVLVQLLVSCLPAAGCPPEEDIGPRCFCQSLDLGPAMWCQNILDAGELVPLLGATLGHDMFSLGIGESVLLYIPAELFLGTRFKRIRFHSTQVMSLSESDVAFEGLEDHLEQIQILEGHFVAQWDWNSLRNLHRLENLNVEKITLASVDTPLPRLETLEALSFIQADISSVTDFAFARLPNLKIVNLHGNALTNIKRNILPFPAAKLYHLDLSSNALNTLPDDMFDGMPNLEELKLENNLFTTLDEAAFAWPVENLKTFDLTGNEIHCDCRLQWLLQRIRKPVTVQATCSLPESLRGVRLAGIRGKDLWC